MNASCGFSGFRLLAGIVSCGVGVIAMLAVLFTPLMRGADPELLWHPMTWVGRLAVVGWLSCWSLVNADRVSGKEEDYLILNVLSLAFWAIFFFFLLLSPGTGAVRRYSPFAQVMFKVWFFSDPVLTFLDLLLYLVLPEKVLKT